MITYGLVQQNGPYSKGGRSSYTPYNNTRYISPKYPVQLSMGITTPSEYALRQVSAKEGLPGGKHPKLNRPNEWLTLLRKIADNVAFSGGLRVSEETETDGTDTAVGPDTGPDTPIVPLSSLMEPQYEGAEGQESSVVPSAAVFDRILPMFQMGIETLSNNQLGNYIARSLPIVSYLVDTQRVTTETALTLLFGRYADPVITAMRGSQELRRRVTDALGDYVANPAAQAIRDALIGQQEPTPRYIDYLGDLLGQAGRDALDAWGIGGVGLPTTATVVAPPVQRGARSLLRFIMRILEVQGAMTPDQVSEVAQRVIPAIQGATGTGLPYLLRNTPARQAGAGFYRETGRAARRIFSRRTALG